MTAPAIVILAAGMGTRMRSRTPKVLHHAAGRSLLAHVLHTARDLGAAPVVVVHGPGDEGAMVAAEARRVMPDVALAEQGERLGTGHAVMQALPALRDFTGTVLVLYGDVPLIRARTLREELLTRVPREAPMAVLGFTAHAPAGYGRLVMGDDGQLLAIREHRDASAEELAIDLCNSGIMAARADVLRELLPRVDNDNDQKEYYLTDLVALANANGMRVALGRAPEEEVLGVNDRVQLAEIEHEFQERLRRRAMRNGATLVDPATVFFAADTEIGRDVLIEPFVFIGPGVRIADEARIRAHSHLEGALVGKGVQVGPFARLRPGAVVEAGARVGNFVEIKKATIEEGAKVNHLSYVGDARVGADANIGAGTITCNYDGFAKHFTDIGKGAFIGSNSALVAPVEVGEGAYVGSGSVITENVPPGALALARSRQIEKPGWAARFRAAMRARLRKKAGK